MFKCCQLLNNCHRSAIAAKFRQIWSHLPIWNNPVGPVGIIKRFPKIGPKVPRSGFTLKDMFSKKVDKYLEFCYKRISPQGLSKLAQTVSSCVLQDYKKTDWTRGRCRYLDSQMVSNLTLIISLLQPRLCVSTLVMTIALLFKIV